MKNKKELFHDKLVLDLEEILSDRVLYQRIWLFQEYNRNGFVGEIDLLGMIDPGIYDFYEVKTSHHNKSKRKARRQYEKYQLAFPGRISQGFMYCSDRLIRSLD